MSFLSLYRKYRPQSFEDLVGQQHVVKTLKNALIHDRIAHAYLFAGPRGTGKTSTAKVFARALNCAQGPTTEPCGECESCRKIEEAQSLDVIEIDAASNRGIDEIRDLREKIKFFPSEGNYKVYIIDEVHMLTKGAFNALLKTLEEPPANVVFILATTEPHRVIDTIMSRCQRFDFNLLSSQDIKKRLAYICQQEGVDYADEALGMIAHSSNGGLRDAISLLDQAISFTNNNITPESVQKMLGKVDQEILNKFFNLIINHNTAEALELVNDLIDRGNGISTFVSDLIEHGRQLLLIKECGIESGILDHTREVLETLASMADRIESNALIRIMEILTEVERDLAYAEQPRLVLEMGIVKMSAPEADNSLDGLQARVAELEYKLRQLTQGKIKKIQEKESDSSAQPSQNEKSSLENENTAEEDIKIQNEDKSDSDKEKKVEGNLPDIDDTKKASLQDNSHKKERINLEEVEKAWPVILKQVKENNISVQAFLIEGKPVKVSNNVITIEFPEDKGFHKRGAEKEGRMIEKVIKNVLNCSCKLEFTIKGKRKKKR